MFLLFEGILISKQKGLVLSHFIHKWLFILYNKIKAILHILCINKDQLLRHVVCIRSRI